MHFDNLNQIHHSYSHIYLSPHLDDAALSCGGAIAQHCAAGEQVLVITVCTAMPSPNDPFSRLAAEFHSKWELAPSEVVAARVRENRAALHLLGADSLVVNCLDAVYRYPEAYHSRETLFGTPAPNDPLLTDLQPYIAQLYSQQPKATFYAPLGVGNHVDHQITHRVALHCVEHALVFYEDFPYVARTGELQRRLGALGVMLQPQTIAIDHTLPQKVRAIQAYRSQLAELAESQLGQRANSETAAEIIAASVADYARTVGAERGTFGERLWRQKQ